MFLFYSTFFQKADTSDGRNDSDSSYDGDVESLLCDSEEPTSDSEDDHSDMLRKGDIMNALTVKPGQAFPSLTN